ncbi:hypothetical protein VOLCADRAFT_100271 [Volvox carteri f. nagariensis]|uniref:EGF-like domain-containing protein n=1 Tax=Volvox carteri f. nagariensis TaxID=3068 RepID=D8UJV8_VOLCA|nr:uncharacterized protein VOLCADRAFT_100271 [Volvox carteri f. nagariensis]EFJ39990.1 hypothetical protein VOLCADRAFT_100271 [Volvox carteri f. nagariensis]|eukprot:XP_002958955.1 hypothetical protein VOLCADRAFT_100271 [Volvox carteri f. nagariensis]
MISPRRIGKLVAFFLSLNLLALDSNALAHRDAKTARNASRRKELDLPRRLNGKRLLSMHGDVGSLALTTATHPDVGLDHLFQPLKLDCHPDCVKRGNCNAEEGRCECPFGYTGPTCEEPLLSGCQRGPGLEPFFGVLVSRNCECLRQANRFFGCSPNNDTCTLASMSFHDVQCYTFPDLPPEQQYSQMPSLDQPGVQYYRGSINRVVDLKPVGPAEGLVGRDIWSRAYLGLPPEKCGTTKCHGRGACVLEVQSTELDALRTATEGNYSPYCMCYKGYMGHHCNEDMLELCPSNCRGRGRCIRGFCHCNPPYWGLDCSRERAWQLAPGAPHIPNRHVLRIYVYDLPANAAFMVALDDNVFDLNEPSYQTHRKFLNPLEANLFFVPANAYAYSSNTNPPTNQGVRVLPKWASLGFPVTEAPATYHAGYDVYLSNVIHVTLFGLHANLRDNTTTFLKPAPEHHPTWGCYHPKKDVLAAPWYDHMLGSKEAVHLYGSLSDAGGEAPNRDLLFFFAGSVRPRDTSYSGGARQALSAHLKALMASGGNYSDIQFVEGTVPDYEALYMRSRFCLAPHGAGFGVRLTLAMTHACIPVIIQDQVYQPYESDGLLPYSQFSLRLSKSDIPYIVDILRSVSTERQKRMRLAMAKYHHAFLWEPSLGGRAYNYTIRALNQRLHGLWGHLWGDPHPAERRHLRVAWDDAQDEGELADM